MSQDQLLNISSTSLFLGFWLYAISLLFYVAHVISPEVEAATARIAQTSGSIAIGSGGEQLFGRARLGVTATGVAYLGYLLMTLGLGTRWAAQGYWPVSNAFEAPLAFSWMIVSVYLVAEVRMRTRIVGWAIFLIVVGLCGYSLFAFGSGSTVIDPLKPALQSFWLTVHVGMAMLSYSLFALGGALSLTYLARTGAWRQSQTFYLAVWPTAIVLAILAGIYVGRWPGSGDAISLGKLAGVGAECVLFLLLALGARATLARRVAAAGPIVLKAHGPEADLLDQLDEWAYRSIAFGVPMIAFVLMSGAIWAQMAWSTFWSWDPKEVWALITFIYYVLYVHVRVQRGWRGAPMAALGVIGFSIVLVSFLGLAYIVGTFQIFSLHTFGNVQ